MCRFLAQDRQVLFVEPKTLSSSEAPDAIENLDFLTLPVFPFNAKNPLIRAMAFLAGSLPPLRFLLERVQARRLRRALKSRHLNLPVFLFGHPEMQGLRKHFPGTPHAYDHMDDVLQFGRVSTSLRRDFQEMIRDASFVVCTSEELEAQIRLAGGDPILRIGNGVEWERFAESWKLPEPLALTAIPVPRVIYTGSVAEWFDFDLLYETARLIPEMSFVIVGPLRPALEKRKKQAPENIHFQGAKPYLELPAWLGHSDLAIIPFQCIPLTRAVDPVKLHEYSAAGLAVVATPFSHEIQSGGVRTAKNAEEFAGAIKEVLKQARDPEALRRKARKKSWERLLEPLDRALDDF
jgi:glycosyltransferase involved in cell wall biosynthesis